MESLRARSPLLFPSGEAETGTNAPPCRTVVHLVRVTIIYAINIVRSLFTSVRDAEMHDLPAALRPAQGAAFPWHTYRPDAVSCGSRRQTAGEGAARENDTDQGTSVWKVVRVVIVIAIALGFAQQFAHGPFERQFPNDASTLGCTACNSIESDSQARNDDLVDPAHRDAGTHRGSFA
jgi:hypothetical protein